MKFAIVDIETTGGSNKSRGITEIGIVVTDGTQILERWTSFVNPFEPIPSRITALTGISDDMVEDAPGFEDLAEDVADAVTWVATRPPHVNVDSLVIKPRAQAAQHKVHRHEP